jgi:uncharacterized membrane protein
MAAHFEEWISLVLRWAHLITGIAWIGASFYFNWLENRLVRRGQPAGTAGQLWAVHGGGFYHVRKLSLAPETLPDELHWFKWEAYTTWITGFALLCIIYYWNASAFLLDPAVSGLSAWQGIAVGVLSLLSSWVVYDWLCCRLAPNRNALLAVLILAWFTALAWALGDLLSARAAYLHVGAAIGTVMVANVFRVIIPAQKDLVTAVEDGREPDAERAASALLRSRHNNYLTLPVLFMMISIHFPGTYAQPWAWLILLALSLAGVSIRHYFNTRHIAGSAPAWLALGLFILAAVAWLTAPERPARESTRERTREPAPQVSIGEVMTIVEARCTSCHANQPSQEGFVAPPLGLVLESEEDVLQHRQRVYMSVAARTMPLANLTAMTEEERLQVIYWYRSEE